MDLNRSIQLKPASLTDQVFWGEQMIELRIFKTVWLNQYEQALG
jgi:hypothetical protein